MPNALHALTKVDKPTSLLSLFEQGVTTAQITGHLGKDPETRFTSNGLPICKGSVAVSWGKRGEADRETEWCEWTAWRDEAELMSQFRKGDAVTISGKLSKESWKDRNGNDHEVGRLTIWAIAKPIWKRRDSVLVPKTPPVSQPEMPEDDIPF